MNFNSKTVSLVLIVCKDPTELIMVRLGRRVVFVLLYLQGLQWWAFWVILVHSVVGSPAIGCKWQKGRSKADGREVQTSAESPCPSSQTIDRSNELKHLLRYRSCRTKSTACLAKLEPHLRLPPNSLP